MLQNFCGGGSSTGGAGPLTLAAAAGLVLPGSVFVDGQDVGYAIDEYSDASLTTLVRAESGFGKISSGNVLTRSAPRSAIESGAPATAPLTFGTSNVRVYITLNAEGGPTSIPARANFNAIYGSGPNEWMYGANQLDFADYGTALPGTNQLWMVPIRVETGFEITSLGIVVTTLVSGGLMNVAIASCRGDTGLPGKILLAANNLSTAATGVVSGSVTGRLLAPGWYWSLFNSSNGTAAIRASTNCAPNPIGGLGSSSRTIRYVTRTRTFADFVVGTDAFSGASSGAGGVNNLSAPLLLWR